MLRIVPIGNFDDMAYNFWEPSMDPISNMFGFVHPDMAHYQRRQPSRPFSTNPCLPAIWQLGDVKSEPDGWIYKVYLPTSTTNSKTGKETSENACEKPTEATPISNTEAQNSNEVTKNDAVNADDQAMEKATERTVTIAQPQKFSVQLDVSGYKPDNITVKIRDRTVFIDAKHQETDSDTGIFIRRELHRSYALPSHVNPDVVISSLDKNSILTVEAPPLESPGTEFQAEATEAAEEPATEKRLSETEIQSTEGNDP